MNLYLAIIKAFLKHDTYNQHWGLLDLKELRESAPEVFRLAQCIPCVHKEGKPGNRNQIDLEFAYQTLYPGSSKEVQRALFKQLEDTDAEEHRVLDYLRSLDTRFRRDKLVQQLLTLPEGQDESESIRAIIHSYQASSEPIQDLGELDFIDDTLDSIYRKQVEDPGLAWRLGSLNKALGPLRKGDFGIICKRPETGGTSFLADQVPFMAGQAVSPILWFNNEEQSEKVLLRCYQGALGKEVHHVFADRDKSRQEYTAATNGNIKFPKLEDCTRQRIEGLCRKYSPSLVIFDQIHKIGGFQGDRDDLEFTAIAQWARQIAATYCPVIGVCQAGITGEGKKWLTMGDVMGSKTGLQGECDWILGIGKVSDDSHAFERYLHLSKNKLLGGAMSDPNKRHDKWSVRFLPEIARYMDFP